MRVHRRLTGQAAAFDPLSLGPFLYLRADQAVGMDGNGCASWPDLSGNGNDCAQATGSKQPIVRDAASPNGLRRMLEFQAGDDILNGTLPGSPGIDVSSGMTLYWYGEEQALSTSGFDLQMIFGCGLIGGGFEWHTRTATIGGYAADENYGINGGTGRAVFGATATGFQRLTAVMEAEAGGSEQYRLFKDGSQLGSAATGWLGTAVHTAYEIGNFVAENSGFAGLYGALLGFVGAHDTPTRQAVEAYLLDFFEG